MKNLWWMGCAFALACAHEEKNVTEATPAGETQPVAAQPADASKQAAVPAAAMPAAAAPSPNEGKIPLSSSAENAELLRRGYDALFTTNIDTAHAMLRKALEQDPNFLVAQVFLYSTTAGTDSMHKVEDATKAGASLPEAERTLLEQQNAAKHGDLPTALEKEKRLIELAPNDPISHLLLAGDLVTQRKLDDAIAELQKASDLDQHLGAPYAQMSFIYDVQGKHDEEVAVLRKWVAARPDDPAAESTLAAGLMAAGKMDEAADHARKALAMEGAGFGTRLTLAYVDEMMGNWAGAREELSRAREIAKPGLARAGITELMAIVDVALHKQSAAFEDLAMMEKDAAEGNDVNDVVRANIDRAIVQHAFNKNSDAVKTARQAADRIPNEAVSDVARGFLTREALVVAVWVDAAAKKPDLTADSLARLEKASPHVDTDAFQADGLSFGRGELAWAKGNATGAVEEVSKCIVEDDLCRYRLAAAQEKTGDKAGAEVTRKGIIDVRHGGKFALLVRAWLTEPKAAAKKVAVSE